MSHRASSQGTERKAGFWEIGALTDEFEDQAPRIPKLDAGFTDTSKPYRGEELLGFEWPWI